MLKDVGASSIEDLFSDIKSHHHPKSFDLPQGKSEFEIVQHLRGLALKNISGIIPFIGGGYYDHYVPAAVIALASRPEFYTAYTPYQSECSQGSLQSLYEYQSAICTLTEMDISNASLYDGGTALYEAVMMAIRLLKKKKVIIDCGVSPIFRKILKTYTSNLNYDFQEDSVVDGRSHREEMNNLLDKETACLVLQNPNFLGVIEDYSDIIEKAHALGILVIQSVYPISLGLIKTPGEMGVDIVTGEAQSLGLSLNFGGPYLGFMAVKKKYARKMPGRIVGATVDKNGKRCFVNTLQAREQHIRREKATSNICTNVALCAIQSVIFMSLLGKEGFKELSQLNLDKAEFAKGVIGNIDGVIVDRSVPTFNEFRVCLPKDASMVVEAMIEKGFAAGFPLGGYYSNMQNDMIVAITEKRTKKEILDYAKALDEVLSGR